MTVKELLKFIDTNQKIIICSKWYNELFRGKVREVNPFNDAICKAEVDFIYLDNDPYTKEYLKIRVKKDK